MEEVRSYWQVASINHFCDLFNKQFKLPEFEPEELEQAFILNIVIPPKPNNQRGVTIKEEKQEENEGKKEEEKGELEEIKVDVKVDIKEDEEEDEDDDDDTKGLDDEHLDDQDYIPDEKEFQNHDTDIPSEANTKTATKVGVQNSRLVDLAIALLQPHFNTTLNYYNWENYLNRIIDSNWVELEHYPSPLRKKVLYPGGIESIQNITFNDLTLSDKIDVIHALCDYRLACEDVQDKLKDFPLEELRLESIGKDSHGYEYWYFSGTRLFRENQELSQDLLSRKNRIIELEDKLVELNKNKLAREQEEKRRADLEKSRQLAAEAREAKRKQQEQEAKPKRKQPTPVVPLRTGLRERRSSAASNNHHQTNHDTDNDTQDEIRIPTTRSKVAKQKQTEAPSQQNQVSTPADPVKNTRTSRGAKVNGKRQDSNASPALPKRSPEEECKEELEKLKITIDERKEAWHIECESLEEWESFAARFEKTKSTHERYLLNSINEYILPKIRAIYARKAAEVRRKEKEVLYSLASRRVSTRLVSRKAQEEEEEKQALVHEAEMRRKKADAEMRLRAELEREMRAKQNRFVINGVGSTCSEDTNDDINSGNRYYTRQHQGLTDSDEFAGIIHPDKLSEFYEALELIVDSVRTSKHAWPFVDPVPKTVHGYYDLIKQPMDLKELRTRVEFREYRSLIELERDFQLIVNNCERFNGPKNTYTKMSYKLWKSFRKNVILYLQRDLEMDEYETFIYPPPKKEESNNDNNMKVTPHPSTSHHIEVDDVQYHNDHDMKNEIHEPPHVQTNHDSNVQNSPSLNSIQSSPDDFKAPTPSPINSPIVSTKIEPSSPKMSHPQETLLSDEPSSLPQINSDTHEQQNEKVNIIQENCLIMEEPCEDIIIDSYDVTCPDENFFIVQ